MRAVVWYLKPFSFSDRKEVMTVLLQSVYEAGQSLPLRVCADRNVYFPSRKAVTNTLNNAAH